MSNSHGGDTGTHLYQSLSVHALYESRFIKLTLIELSILLVYSKLISSRYVSMSQSLKYLTMMSVYSIHSCLLAILDVSFRLFAQFFALNPPFHYVLRPRKHRFIWFLRQNPSKNYFAISLLRFRCQVFLQGQTLDLHAVHTVP